MRGSRWESARFPAGDRCGSGTAAADLHFRNGKNGWQQSGSTLHCELWLYLPSLRGEFTASTTILRPARPLYLPSLRGEFTAVPRCKGNALGCIYPHCEGSSQLPLGEEWQEELYLPSLRGEFTAYKDQVFDYLGCIYPHCEGSSQQNVKMALKKLAVFTLIARGVHSRNSIITENERAVFTLIARGVHSVSTVKDRSTKAVFTLIARGVHSRNDDNKTT